MIKKSLKKAGAVILTMALLLGFMPLIEVSAAGTATVGDITVSGNEGGAINETLLTITLSGDTFKDLSMDYDAYDWFTNIPMGLYVVPNEEVSAGATTVTLNIYSTPLEPKSEPMAITIPGECLASGQSLTVAENPNAKWDIQAPAADTRKAAFADVTVSGSVNQAITATTVTINLEGETSKAIDQYDEVTDWFKNMPAGMDAVIAENTASGATSIKIKLRGTPTEAKSGPIQCTIDKDYLASKKELKVTENNNAKWNITATPATASRPKITTNLSDEEVTYKQGATAAPLTIAAESPDGGTLTYQWLKNTSNNSTGETKIAGATQPSYTPPTNTAGTMYYRCRVTNTVGDSHETNATWFAKITVTAGEQPAITTGAGSNYQIGAGKDITFICSGALEDLTDIYVDNKLVDKSNYTVKSGSTVLTLKAGYLDTLSVGKHTLKFLYKGDLSAETSFTITAKDAAGTANGSGGTTTGTANQTTSPKTGDTTNTMLLFSLMALSAGAVVITVNRRKKAENQ